MVRLIIFIVFRRELYGENSIDVKVKSYSRLFVEEVRILQMLCWKGSLRSYLISHCIGL